MNLRQILAYALAAILATGTVMTGVNAFTTRPPVTTTPVVVVTYYCPAEDDPGWEPFECGDRTSVHRRSRDVATPADLWP